MFDTNLEISQAAGSIAGFNEQNLSSHLANAYGMSDIPQLRRIAAKQLAVEFRHFGKATIKAAKAAFKAVKLSIKQPDLGDLWNDENTNLNESEIIRKLWSYPL